MDFAAIGLVEAVQDRHQGRFSRTVFTDDAVDRTLADFQIDVLVGVDRAETFVDPTQFDGNIVHIGLAIPKLARFGILPRNRAGDFFTIWYKFIIDFSGRKPSIEFSLYSHQIAGESPA
ncbi:hypothetical protein D9M72_445610 [compost metagenome]